MITTLRAVSIDNAKSSAIQNSLNEINPHVPTSFYPVEVHGKTIWVIELNSRTQKHYALSNAESCPRVIYCPPPYHLNSLINRAHPYVFDPFQ